MNDRSNQDPGRQLLTDEEQRRFARIILLEAEKRWDKKYGVLLDFVREQKADRDAAERVFRMIGLGHRVRRRILMLVLGLVLSLALGWHKAEKLLSFSEAG